MRKRQLFLISLCMIMFVLVACQGNKDPEDGIDEGVTEDNESATMEIEEDVVPIVTLEMEDGRTMEIELYPSIAPNTVNNFISLVEDGFYDGLIFHRVIPGFVIQGGDPEGTGMGGPGYTIKGEFSSNGFENRLKHDRGVISMARSQHPDSAGSQFFIIVNQADDLNDDYAAFGKVTSGMDLVDDIVEVERDANDKPKEDQVIKKMTVDLQGYEPADVVKE